MGEAIQIELLGGLRITRDGRPVAGYLSRKVPALLAYLAVTGTPQPRDRLATLLWGDYPEAHARNNLRQALANLNRLTGGCLVITRVTVGLHPDSPPWCDATTLETALQRVGTDVATLQEVADLYTGAFLEGFAVPDAPTFEEWALALHPGRRGVPLTMTEHRFTSLADAERFVFRLRWKKYTGHDLG